MAKQKSELEILQTELKETKEQLALVEIKLELRDEQLKKEEESHIQTKRRHNAIYNVCCEKMNILESYIKLGGFP